MTVRELIRRYAEETGIPYEVARTAILASYAHMKEIQENMEHMYMTMGGIGTWTLKVWKAERFKAGFQKSYNEHPTTYKQEMIAKFNRMIEMYKEEKERKNRHWEYRLGWEKEQEEKEKYQKQYEQQTTTTQGESAESLGE